MKNLLFLFLIITGHLFGQKTSEQYTTSIVGAYDYFQASKAVELKIPESLKKVTLPPSVDNSTLKYFPGITDQGFTMSCGQFAAVEYCYAYEMDLKRDIPASAPEGKFPAFYTFNYMNEGLAVGPGVSIFYSWDEINKQGHPAMDVYPPVNILGTRGWMNGYDRYYSSMHNRIGDVFSIHINTDEGIETLKHYLFDHLDGSSHGGMAVLTTSGNFSGNIKTIPEVSPEAGKPLIVGFYPMATHNLTIVGYNDSIRYDLNNDGMFTNDVDINGDGIINPCDYEFGAWRVANSYGTEWQDSGFVWIMYRAMALDYNYSNDTGNWNFDYGIWNNAVYIPEPITDYSPLLTMSLKITHNERNRIAVLAGISSDTLAELPQKTISFPIWNFQGGAFPVAETYSGTDAIEAGFDITPLLSDIEPGKNYKLFLLVDENDEDVLGEGIIREAAFHSYISGNHQICEIPEKDVPVVNNGLTVLSLPFSLQFDKVSITSNGFPVNNYPEPVQIQMTAKGGKPPYKWDLMHQLLRMNTDSAFPVITSQQVSYQSQTVPFTPVVLPFSFPFMGKKYDTVYMNAYGFIGLTPDQLPYPYINDPGEMFRYTTMIAPLLSLSYNIESEDHIMWVEKGSDKVTFRWKLPLNTEFPQEASTALRIYDDGRFELLYGNIDNSFSQVKAWTGWSAGNDSEYEIIFRDNVEETLINNEIYLPMKTPGSSGISKEGIFTANGTDPGIIYNFRVKVSDDNGISDIKEFQLTTALSVSASAGPVTQGAPAPVRLILKNLSSNAISGLTLRLTSSVPGIKLNDSTENISMIEPGEGTEADNAFSITCDSLYPDKAQLPFIITATSGENTWVAEFALFFSSTDIRIGSVAINDGVDGLLDPGEVAEMSVTLNNTGTAGTGELTATLAGAGIEILSSNPALTESLPSCSSASVNFLVRASDDLRTGDTIPLVLELQHNAGSILLPFRLVAGRIRVALLNFSTNASAADSLKASLDELGVSCRSFTGLPQKPEIYDIAFVTTTSGSSINDEEKEILDQFLLKGNRMYLEGLLYWKNNQSSQFTKRFYDSIDNPVPGWYMKYISGSGSSFLQDINMRCNPVSVANFYFMPVDPGFVIMETQEGNTVQIAYDGDDYKTIGSLVQFNRMTDSTGISTKDELMRRYLHFFGLSFGNPYCFFHSDRTTVNENDSVRFYDDSFENISSHEWSFPGGTPSSSNLKDPVIFYDHQGIYDVTLKVTSGDNENKLIKKGFIRVGGPDGIRNVYEQDMILYPNPAKDYCYIENTFNPEGIYSYQIITMHGKIIRTGKFHEKKHLINLNGISAGMYLLQIKTEKESSVLKLLISGK